MRSIDTGTGELLAHVEDGVAVVTLNRPERRNALSRALLEALARTLAEVEADEEGLREADQGRGWGTPVRPTDPGPGELLAHGEDGGAVVTPSRPERRNALSRALLEALARTLAEVEADEEVACVVLTGAGGAFSAGGDVKDLAAGDGDPPFDAPGPRHGRNPPETAGRPARSPTPTD